MDEGEREQWRGMVDERLRSYGTQLRDLWAVTTTQRTDHNRLEIRIENVAVRIGVYAALGAILGGGIVSAVVSFLLRIK